MRGATEREGAAWSWFIGAVAVGLLAWAVAELVGVGGGGAVVTVSRPVAGEPAPGVRGEPVVELHRLLPDATDDLGRLVSVDGTVAGDPSSAGFWVRDFRDNIIFVEGARAVVRAGVAVRVVGRVALLLPDEQADRLERAGLVVPASAVVIRDVKIVPTAGGIDVLER